MDGARKLLSFSCTIAILVIWFGTECTGYCPTNARDIGIKNGDYYFRSSNTIVKYVCNDGYYMYGNAYIACFGDNWSETPPKCIKNTCQNVIPGPNLHVTEEFNGSMLKFSCSVLNKLVGSAVIYCDGTNWNDSIPTCISWDPPRRCNFENEDLCGYSHDDDAEQQWKRNLGDTKTTRTGPEYDHTYGSGGTGHYMYFEASSPTRTGHSAILQSPLYPATDSHQRCVTFWYHILGVSELGDLKMYIHPESKNMSDLTPHFHVATNMGEEWQLARIPVPVVAQPFRILFIATRGSSYRSDIGLDDVALITCNEGFTPTSSAFTNTVVTHRTTPVMESMTRSTTLKLTTTRKQTMRTTTTAKPTTTVKTSTTVKSTMASSTTIQTTRPSSASRRTLSQPTPAPVTRKTTPMRHGKTSATSMSPRINSNVPSKAQPLKHNDKSLDDDMKVVYITVGVILVALIAAGVGLGLYCYHRQIVKRKRADISSEAINPLYTAMEGDEAMINFAIDTDYEQVH